MPGSRDVLAFLPQHTTTKSRIMAIVDRGDGMEIDAIATVDRAHEARALCNLLNTPDQSRAFSGLWHALDAAVKANLERAGERMVDKEDDRYLAPLFVHALAADDDPSTNLPGVENIDWVSLFTPTLCPEGGCENCTGCRDGQCGPGGSCPCLSEHIEDCPCPLMNVGPRWAAGIYESLCGSAEVLFEHAQQLMWGIEDSVWFVPRSLTIQPPAFYERLAQGCASLAKAFAHGQAPAPRTIAELIMLDAAAREAIAARTGAGNEQLDIDDLAHLPEGHGDFDLDALWMFQLTDSDWQAIVDSDTVYEPDSMDHIFDLLPEAMELR